MLKIRIQSLAIAIATLACALLAPQTVMADSFKSEWHAEDAKLEQVWIGESYWANRLQDWKIKNQRLECVETRTLPYRTVHMLTLSTFK